MKCPNCGTDSGSASAAGVCPGCDHDFTFSLTPREEAYERFRATIAAAVTEAREYRERADAWRMIGFGFLALAVGAMLAAPLFVVRPRPAPEPAPEASPRPANDRTGGHKLVGFGLAGPAGVRNSWPATWGENVGECRIVAIDEAAALAVIGGPAIGAASAKQEAK